MNKSEIIEFLKVIIPTSIALVAAIFSILTYRRNRRFDNENYIYKTKHENYSKILFELGCVIDLLQKYIADLEIFLKDQNELDEDLFIKEVDFLYESLEKIDNSIANFENLAIAHSLVVPKSVIEKIDSITDLFNDFLVPEPDDINLDKILPKIDEKLDPLIDFANQLNEIIRIDLKVEEINFYLYKRLKK